MTVKAVFVSFTQVINTSSVTVYEGKIHNSYGICVTTSISAFSGRRCGVGIILFHISHLTPSIHDIHMSSYFFIKRSNINRSLKLSRNFTHKFKFHCQSSCTKYTVNTENKRVQTITPLALKIIYYVQL